MSRARKPDERLSNEPPEHSDPFVLRLLDNLPGMAYRCRNDPDWTMEFVSAGAKALTGLSPRSLTGDDAVPYGRLIHPDDRDRVWREVREALSRHEPFRVTYRIRRADGGVRWVWEQGVGVPGRGGSVEALEGFVTDVTERVTLPRQVAAKEVEQRALLEQPLVGVYVVRSGRFDYVNERLADVFGYTVEEVRALESVTDLVHPDDRALVTHNLQEGLRGSTHALRYEFRGLRRGGGICEVEVYGRGIETDRGPAVLGVLLDVTDRKSAQRRYHEAQKMEALGMLAAGVAHDFRNILAVIKTTTQLAVVEQGADPSLQSDLADILDAVDRGVALTHELTRFGRSGSGEVTSVSLSAIVREATPMLERTVGPEIEISCSLDPGLPAVRIPRAHLEEVVTNLVFNARDAMPEGGTITVRTYGAPEGPREGQEAARGLPHAVLEVADHGRGIPDETLKRIFEPYFTTKGSEGTGLGLANVWRMCSEAGGAVTVESAVDVGSTFRVFLPLEQPRSAGGAHPDR